MIHYKGHIVYVVTVTYPETGDVMCALAAATLADLGTAKLGVLKDGRCLPLSDFEHKEVAKRNGKA